MKLYLVQHGIPKSEDEDPQRPLSQQGVTEVKAMAAYLASKSISVSSIYYSPKLRAKQTAEIFAEFLKPTKLSEDNNLKPLDEPGVWIKRIQNTVEDIMLIGHLPHLQRLASELLINNSEKPLIAFRQAGVVCLENSSEGWLLKWALVPELL